MHIYVHVCKCTHCYSVSNMTLPVNTGYVHTDSHGSLRTVNEFFVSLAKQAQSLFEQEV